MSTPPDDNPYRAPAASSADGSTASVSTGRIWREAGSIWRGNAGLLLLLSVATVAVDSLRTAFLPPASESTEATALVVGMLWDVGLSTASEAVILAPLTLLVVHALTRAEPGHRLGLLGFVRSLRGSEVLRAVGFCVPWVLICELGLQTCILPGVAYLMVSVLIHDPWRFIGGSGRLSCVDRVSSRWALLWSVAIGLGLCILFAQLAQTALMLGGVVVAWPNLLLLFLEDLVHTGLCGVWFVGCRQLAEEGRPA